MTWRAGSVHAVVTWPSWRRGTLGFSSTRTHAAMSTHRILGHHSLAIGSSFLWGFIELFALWRARLSKRRSA
jgi:hypothetical protein